MSKRNGQTTADVAEKPADLQRLYDAVQAQRASDAERLRKAVREREYLSAIISEINGSVADLEKQVEELEAVKAYTTIRKLAIRKHRPPTLFDRFAAAILLRIARRYVRADRFVEAEAIYQAVAVFKPRPFLVKQVGNMLFRQGRLLHAVKVLESVEDYFDGDEEYDYLLKASQEGLKAQLKP